MPRIVRAPNVERTHITGYFCLTLIDAKPMQSNITTTCRRNMSALLFFCRNGVRFSYFVSVKKHTFEAIILLTSNFSHGGRCNGFRLSQHSCFRLNNLATDDARIFANIFRHSLPDGQFGQTLLFDEDFLDAGWSLKLLTIVRPLHRNRLDVRLNLAFEPA